MSVRKLKLKQRQLVQEGGQGKVSVRKLKLKQRQLVQEGRQGVATPIRAERPVASALPENRFHPLLRSQQIWGSRHTVGCVLVLLARRGSAVARTRIRTDCELCVLFLMRHVPVEVSRFPFSARHLSRRLGWEFESPFGLWGAGTLWKSLSLFLCLFLCWFFVVVVFVLFCFYFVLVFLLWFGLVIVFWFGLGVFGFDVVLVLFGFVVFVFQIFPPPPPSTLPSPRSPVLHRLLVFNK